MTAPNRQLLSPRHHTCDPTRSSPGPIKNNIQDQCQSRKLHHEPPTQQTPNPCFPSSRTMADDSKGGRIAIKFGGSSSSSSKPKTPASSLGKRPRPAFGGADSDSDDDGRHHGKHETITGFGADGAETERKRKESEAKAAKKDYVIARQPNRDWRNEIKEQRNGARGGRGKNLLPDEARAAQQDGGRITTVDTAPADQASGIQWGLTVKEKNKRKQSPDEDDTAADAAPTQPEPDNKKPAAPPQSADEEAMDALLGRRPAKEDKVIVTEDDAYARDVSAAGAASTLADYEAMPVEEFGAALLRGMGWNGEPRGAKPKEVRRRQNRLGLGAKELNEAEDLGGWNQKGGGGRGGKKRPPKLADYRREEERKKEERRGGGGGGEDSYKREREREREERRGERGEERDHDRHGHRHGHSHRERERDRDGDRHRGYDRDRRR
ncbi:hypothetical protein PWT90_08648 [Aphanocladium album]|nr:hypothetical protein PWT90_08648 [Aphanocladium album]